jgi:hypothetical protein
LVPQALRCCALATVNSFLQATSLHIDDIEALPLVLDIFFDIEYRQKLIGLFFLQPLRFVTDSCYHAAL